MRQPGLRWLEAGGIKGPPHCLFANAGLHRRWNVVRKQVPRRQDRHPRRQRRRQVDAHENPGGWVMSCAAGGHRVTGLNENAAPPVLQPSAAALCGTPFVTHPSDRATRKRLKRARALSALQAWTRTARGGWCGRRASEWATWSRRARSQGGRADGAAPSTAPVPQPALLPPTCTAGRSPEHSGPVALLSPARNKRPSHSPAPRAFPGRRRFRGPNDESFWNRCLWTRVPPAPVPLPTCAQEPSLDDGETVAQNVEPAVAHIRRV